MSYEICFVTANDYRVNIALYIEYFSFSLKTLTDIKGIYLHSQSSHNVRRILLTFCLKKSDDIKNLLTINLFW